MSTNYYWMSKRGDEPIHIGKSSAGWTFQLNLITEANILSLDDWMDRWLIPDCHICDEFGGAVTPEEMFLNIVTPWAGQGMDINDPPKGYETFRDYLHANHACIDPNLKVLRSLPTGGQKIRWGESWDEIFDTEFS